MRLRLATLVIGLLAASAPAARATDQGSAVLASPDAVAAWTGAFENVAVPSAAACTPLTCDTFTLDVRLAGDGWANGGGVVVSIERDEAVPGDLGYQLRLVVFGPDGSEAGHSYNVWSGAGVLIERPRNGLYRVVVFPEAVAGRVTYRGFASVEQAPAVEPVRDLLPNLIARPPGHPQIRSMAVPAVSTDRRTTLLAHESYGPHSCFAPELAAGAARCLRFDQTVGNEGDGPLELRYYGDADNRMYQHIERSDGKSHNERVGNVEFHAMHGHFHYAGFAQSFLYRASDGALVRTGQKAGFCMVDFTNLRFGRRGQAAARYPVDVEDAESGCGFTSYTDEQGTYTYTGLSVGWADIYPWWGPDQYMEISGVPDGTYLLELRVNIDGSIVERDYTDNAASVVIEIAGDTVRQA
jgi:hypothetical protein